MYAPILPSRAYDHTPAPSPPPHLARKQATDHVSTGTGPVRIRYRTYSFFPPLGVGRGGDGRGEGSSGAGFEPCGKSLFLSFPVLI